MTSVGLHAKHGCVTVLLGRNLYVGTPAGWTSTDVPEGTLWVALGEAGVVWAVGSRLSNRIPGAAREAAAWRRAHWGRPWELVPVSLSFWDALRAVRGGGYEAFRAVNAGKSSVVFASECAWFVDDLSSFLYVWHEGGRCTMQRLRDRQLARIERDDSDMPRAFTTDGEAWLFDGRRFRPAGLAARLKRSLYTEAEQQYTVQMAYSPPVISGVVTLWYAGRRVGHRTIASKDDGVSWMFGDLIPPEILQRFIAGWISRVG